MRIGIAIALVLAGGIGHAQPIGHGDDLPKGAWPGVGLEALRGLRACTLDDPAPRVNHEITCRPPVLPRRAHYTLGIGWSTGLVEHEGDLQGTHALVITADWWLTRSLGLGVHAALAAVATPAMATGLANAALLIARWRQWTDEVDRDGFTLALGGGVAARDERLGGTSPVVRAAIARDLGYMLGEQTALTWSWELAVEQDLGDARYRTLTAGIRTGFERGIREPRNVHEKDRDPPFAFAIAGEFRGSLDVGLGASVDLALGRRMQWRTTLLWNAEHDDDGTHGVRATWGAVTGPRVAFAPGATLVPYLEAQAGPAALGGDPAARFGVLAEAELGLAIPLFCQTRLDLGGRIQTEVSDGVDMRTGFFMLRVAHGTALRRAENAHECTDDTPFAR